MGQLNLKSVTKSFGKTDVIKGVDLEVRDGEFCVFVGPSGCGKSTLLRMIAGLEDTTSGDIQIDGRRVNEAAPADREIAMVFQSYALYPHLTVRDNMALGLKQAGTARATIDERVENAARMLSLDALLARRPAELSGGQRQRVAIGRAIVRTPKLFLFDEPLSNLDAELRVATRDRDRASSTESARQGDDDLRHPRPDRGDDARRQDRRAARRPRSSRSVAPLELYDDPANDVFVAGFIGSPQMNFLKAGPLGAPGETLGVRPEHLAISREAGAIPGRVSHVEHLGGETNVYVRTEPHGLLTVRRFGEAAFAVDEPVHLTPDTARAFHFGGDGRRLAA